MAPRLDFATLIDRMVNEGGLAAVANNPRAQFGTPQRNYVGHRLLPERTVPSNSYTESNINLLTIIANAGPRYGPAQLKHGAISASFNVTMGHSDIARELDSQDLDAIRQYLGRNMDLPAMATLTNFADMALNRALIEHDEKNIWDVLVDAEAVLRGDQGYEVTIPYLDPAGHRVDAGGDWTSAIYDPLPDIMAIKRAAAAKGRVIREIWTSSEVAATVLSNAKMLARTGNAVIQSDGSLQILQTQATMTAIDNVLQANGLPAIQTYDLTYRTQTGSGFFLRRDAMVFICGQDAETTIDLGDNANLVLPNVLGYTAIGTPAGAAAPGRVLRTEYRTDKPPRIIGEAWAASAPVVTQPEDVFVIKNITTGA